MKKELTKESEELGFLYKFVSGHKPLNKKEEVAFKKFARQQREMKDLYKRLNHPYYELYKHLDHN